MGSYLHWADYLIFIGFLVASLAIGFYHSLTGGRQKTTDEFIMGNRRLKAIPTALSLLMSFYSAITMLGLTAEMYIYGAQLLVFAVITPAAFVLIVERFFVPWLYPLKLVSMFDYLEMRFQSKTVRIFGSALGIIWSILHMGGAMFAPSAALEAATGLPISVSMPVMAVVSVAYTALGGMRAVIWTDVFQFFVMMGGIIAIFVKGLMLVGGISNVFKLAADEGRMDLINVSFDPRERHTVWSLVIGMGIACIFGYGLTQPAVQRFSAVETLAKARATILWNVPPMIAMNVMSCIIGLIVLAYYSNIQCDPLANGDISNPNMLLSYFVVNIFASSPGFSGVFLATLYGGALSTMSSALNGSAANIWEDILKYKLNHLPESKKAIINRLLVVLCGALATGVAFLSATVPGPITQVMMAMVGSVAGPSMALFLLGAASKHANWKGTMIGGVVGVIVSIWLSIGSLMVHNLHPPLPPVSVEQCSLLDGNSTLFPFSSLNYTNYTDYTNNYTSYDIYEGIATTDNWNETTETTRAIRRHPMAHLHGLDNFYAMSYMWFLPFGALVTFVVGIIASLILRDKDLEAQVEDRLLLRYYGCGCSDENENKDQLDDKNKASLEENESLSKPEDGLLEDVEMTIMKKAALNGIHKETKSDIKNETEDELLMKNDQC